MLWMLHILLWLAKHHFAFVSTQWEDFFCFGGMLNHLNLHQSVLQKCNLQFGSIYAISHFNLWLLLQKDTVPRALSLCFFLFIRQPVCNSARLFFLCNSRKDDDFPCLLNYIFPSFDIIALAAWMNNNGGGDFSRNYEVDFPDDLQYYSIFL